MSFCRSLLFLSRVFVRLSQKARSFDPVGLRTEKAFIHRCTMKLILCHLPEPRRLMGIELGDLSLVLRRILSLQVKHGRCIPTTEQKADFSENKPSDAGQP